MAFSGHRARQRDHGWLSRCDFWISRLPRKPGRRWLSQGGYESISRTVVHIVLRAQRLLLEYDDARSGSFEALREVPEEKFVVLGLITTKEPKLESAVELRQRITDASRFVPMDRLGLSPQCGFSSSIVGNRISLADQKRKLELVVRMARELWG